MAKQHYISVLLEGYIDNKDNMVEYLIKQCNRSEQAYISKDIFFMQLSDAYDDIRINKKYDEAYDKYMFNAMVGPGPNEEKPEDVFEPDIKDFGIDLAGLSGYSYRGQLWQDDLKYIKMSIEKAQALVIARKVETTEVLRDLELASIFNEKTNAFQVCKDVLEDLDITIGGKPFNTPGKMGKLTGAITAFMDTLGMIKLDNPTEMQILGFFNTYLGTTYTSFSKRNRDYLGAVDTAKTYIKRNYKK
jgi:hypothetical protein